MSELPLFGYTVYMVLRVSNPALPSPGLLGLNRQHLVLMDPSSQVGRAPAPVLAWAPSGHWSPTPDTDPTPQELCCSIALRDLQRLHLLSPLEAEGSPGLELNYGSADNPQTIWFELLQVGGLHKPREGGECLTQAQCARLPEHRLLPRALAWQGWGTKAGGWWGSPALMCPRPHRPGS